MKQLLFYSAIILSLASCTIDEVQSIHPRELRIVSTFLDSKDTLLFSAWSKSEHIRVRIKKMEVDSIIDLLEAKQFNSGIDLIITNNLLEHHKLYQAGLLEKTTPDELLSMDSEQYAFSAFGINPYLFATKADSIKLPTTYQELTERKFTSEHSKDEEIPLLAAFLSRMNRAETFSWIKKFEANKDSIQNPIHLKNYSALDLKKENYQFPGARVSGTIYNLTSAAIVKQTGNSKTALSFITYYRRPEPNKRLCKKLQLISVDNPEGIRLYRAKPEELIQYYEMIERMLSKVQRD